MGEQQMKSCCHHLQTTDGRWSGVHQGPGTRPRRAVSAGAVAAGITDRCEPKEEETLTGGGHEGGLGVTELARQLLHPRRLGPFHRSGGRSPGSHPVAPGRTRRSVETLPPSLRAGTTASSTRSGVEQAVAVGRDASAGGVIETRAAPAGVVADRGAPFSPSWWLWRPTASAAGAAAGRCPAGTRSRPAEVFAPSDALALPGTPRARASCPRSRAPARPQSAPPFPRGARRASPIGWRSRCCFGRLDPSGAGAGFATDLHASSYRPETPASPSANSGSAAAGWRVPGGGWRVAGGISARTATGAQGGRTTLVVVVEANPGGLAALLEPKLAGVAAVVETAPSCHTLGMGSLDGNTTQP